MSDWENDDDLLEEEDEKKKKGDGEDEGEAGQMSRGHAAVSEGFLRHMLMIGASKERIAEVLQQWRHLKGESLFKKIREFAKMLIKSDHILVQIDEKQGHAVVYDFIQDAKERTASPKAQPSPHSNKPDTTLSPK